MKNRAQSPVATKPRKMFPTTGTREAYLAEVAYWQRLRPELDLDWKPRPGAGAMVDGVFIPDIPAARRGKAGKSRLREIRLARGLTQARLEALSGVPATAISAIEHGRIPTGLVRARKLGAALKVSFHILLAAASP